jgi:hypothetical protein
MMRRPVQFLILGASAVLAVAGAPRSASAQVSIPNIQNPINKAKAAAGKTSDQINATNKIGNEKASNAPGAAAAAQAADQQKKAPAGQQKVTQSAPPKGAAAPGKASAPQKGAAAPGKAGAKAAAKPDTMPMGAQSASQRGKITIYREAFAYNAGGRRDPFVSLMLSGELRPIITDLVLTGVIYDDNGGRRSIGILVDVSTGETYRVRAGQTLARMRVTSIQKESISFSIDEFGLSRSETLIIDKTRKGPATAPRRP